MDVHRSAECCVIRLTECENHSVSGADFKKASPSDGVRGGSSATAGGTGGGKGSGCDSGSDACVRGVADISAAVVVVPVLVVAWWWWWWSWEW